MKEKKKEISIQKKVTPPPAMIAEPVTSPAELIKIGLGLGANMAELKTSLEVQERWEANQARKAYHIAMAAFKANPPEIEKDKTVAYKEVKYNHASLANVASKINEALSKHGLSASWITNQTDKSISVTCKITHAMGHSEETTLSAPADVTGSKNAIQAIGSTITYLQRYTVLSLTGLATSDMDDDGRSAEPIKYITDEQLSEIRDILDNVPQSELRKKQFLKIMKVEKLEEIQAKDYPKTKQLLASIPKGEK